MVCAAQTVFKKQRIYKHRKKEIEELVRTVSMHSKGGNILNSFKKIQEFKNQGITRNDKVFVHKAACMYITQVQV